MSSFNCQFQTQKTQPQRQIKNLLISGTRLYLACFSGITKIAVIIMLSIFRDSSNATSIQLSQKSGEYNKSRLFINLKLPVS